MTGARARASPSTWTRSSMAHQWAWARASPPRSTDNGRLGACVGLASELADQLNLGAAVVGVVALGFKQRLTIGLSLGCS